MIALATRIGASLRHALLDVGASARLFFTLLARSPRALTRFVLVREQIYYLGNRSLSIIGVSGCLLYTSPSPRDQRGSRMPSSA